MIPTPTGPYRWGSRVRRTTEIHCDFQPIFGGGLRVKGMRPSYLIDPKCPLLGRSAKVGFQQTRSLMLMTETNNTSDMIDLELARITQLKKHTRFDHYVRINFS